MFTLGRREGSDIAVVGDHQQHHAVGHHRVKAMLSAERIDRLGVLLTEQKEFLQVYHIITVVVTIFNVPSYPMRYTLTYPVQPQRHALSPLS